MRSHVGAKGPFVRRRFARRWLAVSVLTSMVGGSALIPIAAEATSTRVYTLGVMNRFVLDDANRWLWPHMIARYGNLFYVELFGAVASKSVVAPTSNRGAIAAPLVDNLDLAELAPVQATAGGGAIVALTDGLFVSLHLSDYENPSVPALLAFLAASSTGDPRLFPWIGAAPPDAPSIANRKFDVFFAYEMEGVADLGLLLSYGSSKYFRSPNDGELTADGDRRNTDDIGVSEFRFLLSGGAEIDDTAAVDVSLGLGFHGLSYAPDERDDLVEGGGGFDLVTDLRSFIGVAERWEIIPALGLRFTSLSAADTANYTGVPPLGGLPYNGDAGREKFYITDVRAKQILLDIGVAGHFTPADFLDFWAGLGYQILSQSAEFENAIEEAPESGFPRVGQPLEFFRESIFTDTVPYLRLALEARIFQWLDFRGGVVKFIRADKIRVEQEDKNDPSANRLNHITRDNPFFDYFVGFAAHHAGFFLDLQIDPNWFRRGPNFLSGASGNMFVNATLGYKY